MVDGQHARMTGVERRQQESSSLDWPCSPFRLVTGAFTHSCRQILHALRLNKPANNLSHRNSFGHKPLQCRGVGVFHTDLTLHLPCLGRFCHHATWLSWTIAKNQDICGYAFFLFPNSAFSRLGHFIKRLVCIRVDPHKSVLGQKWTSFVTHCRLRSILQGHPREQPVHKHTAEQTGLKCNTNEKKFRLKTHRDLEQRTTYIDSFWNFCAKISWNWTLYCWSNRATVRLINLLSVSSFSTDWNRTIST